MKTNVKFEPVDIPVQPIVKLQAGRTSLAELQGAICEIIAECPEEVLDTVQLQLTPIEDRMYSDMARDTPFVMYHGLKVSATRAMTTSEEEITYQIRKLEKMRSAKPPKTNVPNECVIAKIMKAPEFDDGTIDTKSWTGK